MFEPGTFNSRLLFKPSCFKYPLFFSSPQSLLPELGLLSLDPLVPLSLFFSCF